MICEYKIASERPSDASLVYVDRGNFQFFNPPVTAYAVPPSLAQGGQVIIVALRIV